jgi:hypothetical protein
MARVKLAEDRSDSVPCSFKFTPAQAELTAVQYNVGVLGHKAAIRKASGEEGVTFDEPRGFGAVYPAQLPQYDPGGDQRAKSGSVCSGSSRVEINSG